MVKLQPYNQGEYICDAYVIIDEENATAHVRNIDNRGLSTMARNAACKSMANHWTRTTSRKWVSAVSTWTTC